MTPLWMLVFGLAMFALAVVLNMVARRFERKARAPVEAPKRKATVVSLPTARREMARKRAARRFQGGDAA